MLSFLTFFTTLSCSLADDVSSAVEDGSSDNPYTLSSAEELEAIRGGVEGYEDWDLDDYYKLTSDIDLSGYDWEPLGDSSDNFTGGLNGAGYTISNLSVDQNSSSVGLFGYISETAYIKNLVLTAGDVSGRRNVGLLVGSSYGTISYCGAEGDVRSVAGGNAGGLVGSNYGTITQCYADVEVTAQIEDENGTSDMENTGGLVGYNEGSIDESYATGVVYGEGDYTGGFAGYHKGSLTNSYSTGEVTGGSDYVGGFLGYSMDGSVSTSYSLGVVSSDDSSATEVNGFVGGADSSDSIFEYCYYNETQSGHSDDYAETIDLVTESSFNGFDFESVWEISSSINDGSPYLQELVP
ncbi:MAG: GLUG motif-containing protein [Spirochaetales bacterium]|nr:GLUG motif-containing protein [Spirochaetales bacterium]